MSQLTLLVLQLVFLLLMWAFIFAIVYALRSDLFGHRVRRADPPATTNPSAVAPQPSSYPSSPMTPGTGTLPPLKTLATATSATRIVVTSGPKAGAEFPLGRDEITIGRASESTVVIRDEYTSTHHARLMLWDDIWMVQDLDSTNGTVVDGARVHVPTRLNLGTPVTIGRTTLELRP